MNVPLQGSCLRLLGIDPGLHRTGWGIIDVQGNSTSHVQHGVITTKAEVALPARLAALARHLSLLIDNFEPHEAAVEDIFVNVNPASTLKLGMARGIALMIPASHNIPVFEYGANHIKKMIVGVGHADKTQVAMMVQRFLPTAGPVDKDSADALAVALCHAHARLINQQLKEKLNQGSMLKHKHKIGGR